MGQTLAGTGGPRYGPFAGNTAWNGVLASAVAGPSRMQIHGRLLLENANSRRGSHGSSALRTMWMRDLLPETNNPIWGTTAYHVQPMQHGHIGGPGLFSEDFIHSIDNPEATISAMVDKRRAENIAENRHVLKCVAEAVLYCARQCIALRGDHEKCGSLGNPGNFLSLLNLIATHDAKLKQH